MKTWMFALAVAIAFCLTGTTSAGDISNDTLADMGLAGMQEMSDEQGMEVRGEGFRFAVVFAFVHNANKFKFAISNGFASANYTSNGVSVEIHL